MFEGFLTGLFIGIIAAYVYFRNSDKEKLYQLNIHVRKLIKKDLERHIYVLNNILENYRKEFTHLNTISYDSIFISKGEKHLLNTSVFFSQISDVDKVFKGKEYDYLVGTYSLLKKYYECDPYKIMDLYAKQWKASVKGTDRIITISGAEFNLAHIYLKKELTETLNMHNDIDSTLHYLKMKIWKNERNAAYYTSPDN